MRKIAVFMLLSLCAGGSALGANINVDGYLNDWGVTVDLKTFVGVNVDNNNWSTALPGVVSWSEDSTTVDGEASKVGPGYGGQNFDVEAAYMTYSSGKLCAAFVSGFDLAGQYGWTGGPNDFYKTGDLFFDIGGDGNWDFAVALSSHDGFLQYHAYELPAPSATEWFTTPTDYGSSAPSQLSGDYTLFTDLGGVNYAYINAASADNSALAGAPYQANDHNVFEVSLSNVPGLVPGDNALTMHYTEDCGNDFFNVSGDVLVPEPCTAILALGAVVAGAYARRRRKGERPSRTDAA